MNTTLPPHAQPLSTPPRIELDDRHATCDGFASDSDTPHGGVPQAVLRPRSTEDVVTVLQWANEVGAGIVPLSSTGRRRRGDTVPQRDNTVMLDLSAMNRLVHADARDKIVIIEPGVDFGTIDRLLEPHGLRAFRPLAPRAGKSVIASYLEREPLITANDHWDVGDPFGGTNLVLGNGRVSPTGTAANEGTLTEQLSHGHRQMSAVGPTNLDLLRVVQGSQGSLAVMTWAAVYCERIPSREAAWFCSADDLAPVLDLARDLLHRRLGNAMFIVDRLQLAMLLGRDSAACQSLAARLPAWTLFVSVSAGHQQTTAKMAWQTDDVRRCTAQYGVQLHDQLEGHCASDMIARLRQAEPVSFRDRPLGAHRELFFMQQLDRVEFFVKLVQDTLAKTHLRDAPLGIYVQPMTQGVNCHVEFTLPYEPSSSTAARDGETWQLAARHCAEAGAFFSRPYGRWLEFAYDRDAGNRSMMRMAKTILDPQGVMNPGRLPY